MIHSGSRNFGLKAANTYHKKAQRFCQAENIRLPDRDLAFLPFDSREGQEYWAAMNFCASFAQANRALIMKRFMKTMKDFTGCGFIDINKKQAEITGSQDDSGINEPWIWIHHNYAAQEKHFNQEVIVHRKGATRAFASQLGIVPGSMGTPSYIVEGLGNQESFMSSSHGAGRRLGRRAANRQLTREQADQAITGVVFSGWRGKFDEAPQVYKNIESVIELQKDLAKPVVKLKPLAVMIGN
jgi:tRNA-splicing ligase RtcB